MNKISHNLKWYREYKRLTQQDLADLLQTTLGRIKMYETGRSTPPIDMLVSIAGIISITLDALIHLELDEMKYRAVKREKVREYKFFDDLATINSRLDKVEKALKQKLKQTG